MALPSDNTIAASYGLSVVVPEGFVVGTGPPVPLWVCGVVSVGAVLPVPTVGAGLGEAGSAGRSAAPVCSAGGSAASPHHSAPAQAIAARIKAALRTVSTGFPARPCLASVAFSTMAALSFVSIALAPFTLSTTQPRSVRSLNAHTVTGTFYRLVRLEKKED